MFKHGRKLRHRTGSFDRGCFSDSFKEVMVVTFGNFINRVNKKHNREYTVLSDEIINATNYANNKKMVLYTNGKELFVRDADEFEEKFEPIK